MKRYILRNKIYFFVFFSNLVFRLIMFLFNGQMRMIKDEEGMLAAGAYLAGRNWNFVMQDVPFYGPGYSVIFFPLWKITSNINIIYWTVMIVGAILVSISSVICCYIIKRYFDINDSVIISLIVFVCSILSLPDMRYINNEPMIVLGLWIIIWKILALISDSQNKNKNTLILFSTASYLLTVHTRTIIIWFVGITIIIMYFIKYKKWLISWNIAFFCTFFMGGSAMLVSKIVQHSIWKIEKTEKLGNSIEGTSYTIIQNLQLFSSNNYKESIVSIFMGNIYTISFFTSGLFVVGIVIILKKIFKRKKITDHNGNIKIYIGIIFSLQCIAVTLVGLIFVWGVNVQKAINQGYTDNYQFKSLTYIRYYSIYCAILTMFVLVYLYTNYKDIVDILRISILIIIFINSFWLKLILPIIKNSEYAFASFSPFAEWKFGDEVTYYKYLPCVLILFLIIGIGWVLYLKNKIQYLLLMMCLMLVYQCGYKSLVLRQTFTDRADESYKIIKEFEEKIEISEIPLYADVRTSGLAPFQLYLNNYTIQVGFPNEEVKTAIVFSEWEDLYNGSKDKCRQQEYLYYQLDENEYIWIKGKELQKAILNMGIPLSFIN